MYVGDDRVEIEVHDEVGVPQLVTVLVASGGGSWLSATRYPHSHSDGGLSTGDPLLDARIRRKAAEELARLDAARRVAEAAA